MDSPIVPMETTHAVIVVPIFAPIITPTACTSVNTPALTKPTTITVVAPELCIMAVIRAPSIIAVNLLSVILLKNCCILPPAVFCIPSAIICIP